MLIFKYAGWLVCNVLYFLFIVFAGVVVLLFFRGAFFVAVVFLWVAVFIGVGNF